MVQSTLQTTKAHIQIFCLSVTNSQDPRIHRLRDASSVLGEQWKSGDLLCSTDPEITLHLILICYGWQQCSFSVKKKKAASTHVGKGLQL